MQIKISLVSNRMHTIRIAVGIAFTVVICCGHPQLGQSKLLIAQLTKVKRQFFKDVKIEADNYSSY